MMHKFTQNSLHCQCCKSNSEWESTLKQGTKEMALWVRALEVLSLDPWYQCKNLGIVMMALIPVLMGAEAAGSLGLASCLTDNQGRQWEALPQRKKIESNERNTWCPPVVSTLVHTPYQHGHMYAHTHTQTHKETDRDRQLEKRTETDRQINRQTRNTMASPDWKALG